MRIIEQQQKRLLDAIRHKGARGLTYLEMSFLGVSSCGWRRLSSDEHPERWLKEGEKLTRGKRDGHTTFVIERVTG